MVVSAMTSNLPAAVLWDLDGTIVDTEPYWITAEMELCEVFSATWTHEDAIAVVGQGLPHTASLMRSRGVDLTIDEIIQSMTSRVLELLEVAVPWRPGAVELMKEIQAAGIPQAMVTMSIERMGRAVARLIPGDPLSLVVSGDHVSASKPDPEAYLLAAERLGVKISECVAFEDSPAGCTSAHTSGAFTIGVPHIVSLESVDTAMKLDSLAGVSAVDVITYYQQDRGAL